ncbi:MAG: phage portal protein [Lautropia sp.]
MRLFGLEISRRKAALSPVGSRGGWMSLIRESFPGAWQRGITVDNRESLLAFSAVYSCVSLIAADIAKLRIKVVRRDRGIWVEDLRDTDLSRLLARPNRYQTRQQFIELWVISRLLHGNAYALIERRAGAAVALYPLDPQRVTPLVTDDGSVYYRLAADNLSGLVEEVIVPSSEIIHDRGACLWHPLVGVSPIYACARTASVGNRIQANSGRFFENMSRPSGILSAPGEISRETAKELKEDWEKNYSGGSIGHLAVLGDGLKYEAMAIPAADAQLIEQLRWTVEDVARCFHVPLYKLGAVQPTYNNVEALGTSYYSDCLQALIEAIEACLDLGLGLPADTGLEVDVKGLMRMDTATQVKALADTVAAGITAPNEARAELGRAPVPGGDTPYLQQQNYSLAALDARDRRAISAEPEDDGAQLRELTELITKGLECNTA